MNKPIPTYTIEGQMFHSIGHFGMIAIIEQLMTYHFPVTYRSDAAIDIERILLEQPRYFAITLREQGTHNLMPNPDDNQIEGWKYWGEAYGQAARYIFIEIEFSPYDGQPCGFKAERCWNCHDALKRVQQHDREQVPQPTEVVEA